MEITFKPTELTVDNVRVMESNEDYDIKQVAVHGKCLTDGEENIFWGELVVKVTDEGIVESSAIMSLNFDAGNAFVDLITSDQTSQIIDL